jgi:hypothetical protein
MPDFGSPTTLLVASVRKPSTRHSSSTISPARATFENIPGSYEEAAYLRRSCSFHLFMSLKKTGMDLTLRPYG